MVLHSTRLNIHKRFPAPRSINILLGHSYNTHIKLVNNYELTMFLDVRGSADWPSHVVPYSTAGFGRIERTALFAYSRAR